jgi:hypothetical protein
MPTASTSPTVAPGIYCSRYFRNNPAMTGAEHISYFIKLRE